MDRYPRSGAIVQGRSGLQTYMAQVYGWMTVGLLLTAFIAWFAANTPAVMMFVFSSKITFFGLIIAQLGLVFVLSGMVQRLSAGMATTLFMLYSALTGLTLIQYIPRLYLLIDRQYLRGGRRDVWRDEPLRLYH
jgi:FtsH-binding integral membrane protein